MAIDALASNRMISVPAASGSLDSVDGTGLSQSEQTFSGTLLEQLMNLENRGFTASQSSMPDVSSLTNQAVPNAINQSTANWLISYIMQNLPVPGLDSSGGLGNSTLDDGSGFSSNSFNPETSLLQQLESEMSLNPISVSNTAGGADNNASSIISGASIEQPVDNTVGTPGQGTLDSVIRSAIETASKKYGVPDYLIRGVIEQESGMNPSAQSQAGALGLMQLMPDTARELGVNNALDPTQNIDGGTKYLSNLLARFDGDTSLALAAYNAGPASVEAHQGIPPYQETEHYVSNVLSLSDKFRTSGW